MIPPSPKQVYFSESLDHTHYSIHPLEYPSFVRHLSAFRSSNGNVPILKFCCPNKNHKRVAGMLSITNGGFGAPLLAAISAFDVVEMVRLAAEYGKSDSKRGNTYFDTGLTSSVCQLRKEVYFGLAVGLTS